MGRASTVWFWSTAEMNMRFDFTLCPLFSPQTSDSDCSGMPKIHKLTCNLGLFIESLILAQRQKQISHLVSARSISSLCIFLDSQDQQANYSIGCQGLKSTPAVATFSSMSTFRISLEMGSPRTCLQHKPRRIQEGTTVGWIPAKK